MADALLAAKTVAAACRKSSNNLKDHLDAKGKEDKKRPLEEAAAAQAAAVQQMPQLAKQAKARLQETQSQAKTVYMIDVPAAIAKKTFTELPTTSTFQQGAVSVDRP